MTRMHVWMVIAVIALVAGLAAPAAADDLTPPAGTFVAVGSGSGIFNSGFFNCGLRTDHTLACWSANGTTPPTPPSGAFTSLSVGSDHACAVRTDATLACWGTVAVDLTPPPGTFLSVSAGPNSVCAIRTDQTLQCWGSNISGVQPPPTGTFLTVGYADSGTLGNDACGLRTDQTLICWGFGSIGLAAPPAGTFSALSGGSTVSCALAADQTLRCWGFDGNGATQPPPGPFAQVSAGGHHACAIRADQTITCWGLNIAGDTVPPPGTYAAVSAGYDHTCAIRTDETLICWGNGYAPASVPSAGNSAVGNPAPVLPTAPTTKPKPKAISAAKAFSLPSAQACVSRRKFTIRIRKLPGITFISAVVRVRGKRVKTVKRSRITAPVNLAGLPQGRFSVRITATASDGRTVTGKRTYHTCTRKRGSPGPKL